MDTPSEFEQPPSYLGERAQEVWYATLAERPSGWLTQLKKPLLAAYCQGVERQEAYERTHAEYREQYPDDLDELRGIEKQIAQAARTVRINSDKLGLSGRVEKKSERKSRYLPPHCSLDRRGVRVPYLSEDADLYLSAVAALEGTERSESALRLQVLNLAGRSHDQA